jgi:hypothetical protein
VIVTSNKRFSGWYEIFSDNVVVAAMIDRLVHHAEMLALRGDSYPTPRPHPPRPRRLSSQPSGARRRTSD